MKLKDELRESEQKLAAAYLKNDQLIEQMRDVNSMKH